ncbi:hypothetical protein J6590_049866 [Homalodisca vitripennis]|nr:hypothetical protein J6590_049866 [Homalodisca vitripennis]
MPAQECNKCKVKTPSLLSVRLFDGRGWNTRNEDGPDSLNLSSSAASCPCISYTSGCRQSSPLALTILVDPYWCCSRFPLLAEIQDTSQTQYCNARPSHLSECSDVAAAAGSRSRAEVLIWSVTLGPVCRSPIRSTATL